MAPAPPCDIPGAQNSTPSRPIWNRADLLRFARADIAGVFGADYAVIDTYARRVRLPTPPYLLVSRVTGLQAQRGAFKPSAITTEYDIPQDAWYSVDGQVPWAVAVESGQCDLLLISYLGIDFSCRGERVYRLLDCTLTFLEEMPLEGDTLRYDIKISRFSHSGDSLLFFFSYECFAGGRTILKMDGGCAGFFSDGELEQGKGVIFSEAELAARRGAPRRSFAAPLTCAHTAFDRRRLLCLTRGDLVGCFGPTHDPQGRNPSLRLPPEAMLMIDRIAAVDPRGGAWGLGLVVAEKDLAPDHWYFPCHFKDDQVLAGSLIGEACAQILQFYHLFLGLQTHTRDARFQPVLDQPQKVRCRGQVLPSDKLLTYRIEVRDIGLAPAAYIKADVEVVLEGKTIVYFEGLGVQLVEKADTDPRRVATPRARTAGIAPFDEAQLREFAIGSVEKCFGTVFSIYQNRRVPRIPNGDLHLISRVLEVENTPEGSDGLGRLLSEYDVLPDPWFYDRCSHFCPPYSVLMELALQPCGFLSACVGAILDFPDIDFYFRNLDGQAYLSREVDLRGKTVTNRVRLLSSTSLKGVIIQKFDFELACDGAPFYRGDAAFGYFTEKALASQVGLDGGEQVSPWCEGEKSRTREVALATLQKSPPERPHFHLASGQLHFLDTALVLAAGGRHGRGYVYARKAVDPRDWFYACHFYQDPVMPGSLGVEAILQAIEIYALHQDLGDDFASPCFRLVSDHRTVWKYRGQILPGAGTMELEVNISEVVQRDQQCLLIADASLWKDGLRIYEIRDAAVCIAESAPCSTSP